MIRMTPTAPRLAILAAALALTAPAALAQPTQEEIAAARLQYLAGDFEAALKVIVPAAEAGDANAQNILGAAYDDGNGVPQDPDIALEWWERSAAQNFDRAIYNIGHRYGMAQPQKAAEYYERAVALGNAPAMYGLGQLHDLGLLTGAPDDEKAADLYQQAVDLGNVFAMNNLGLLHVQGEGVAEDLDYAYELFTRAAEEGHAEGLANLGVMFNYGYATRPDPLASMAIYEMAAAMGNGRAAVNLAFDLIEGPEGLRDPVRGWAWCIYGMANGAADETADLQSDCAYLAGLLDEETRSAGETMTPGMID